MRAALSIALLLSVGSIGCASEKGFRDFAPRTPAALVRGAPSPETDALVARFYGRGGLDRPSLLAALARDPRASSLHEIAGYDALTRGDTRAAFDAFYAAASDPDAVATELYLWELEGLARGAADHQRLVSLLGALKDGHARVAVRQLATYDLARELVRVGEVDQATELTRTLGFIPGFQVIGAFDDDQGKGFETDYAPEQGLDLQATYAGVRLPVRFRPVAVSPLDGGIDLADVVWPSASAVAYAVVYVTSPSRREVDLRLTTSAATRVWVGDHRLASDDGISRDALDNLVVRATLATGTNRVLVKLAHESGPFRFAARVTNPDGSPAADLAFSTTPAGPLVTIPNEEMYPAAVVAPIVPIDHIRDMNRHRFLEGRLRASEGRARRASQHLTPLLADAGDNPTVALFAARALMDNGEAGKALDLLTRGVTRYHDLLGFLEQRARFYEGRGLHEKAERDLVTVLRRSPGATDARMALAAAHGARSLTIDRCMDLEAVRVNAPDDASALYELARCKADRGYRVESERLLRRARALAPGDARILYALADAAERRLDTSAEHDLLRAVKAVRPTSFDAAVAIADAYRREGKAKEARAALEEARAMCPDAPLPYDRLAEMAYERADVPEAVRNWRLALEREPEQITVAQRLAALAPSSRPLVDRIAPKADEIDRAVRSAAGRRAHAGSHTAALLDDAVVSVNVDGSSKRIVTQVTEAITTSGRDQLIQAHLPGGGRVVVLEAYAITKGERQEASSVQGGVVRFRGLETGSITVLQFAQIASPPRFLPSELAATWFFQGASEEVEASRYRLILPKDRALHAVTRGPVEASSEIVGDQKVWSFSAKKIPPLVPEPNMGPVADELAQVSVSTLASWDAFARWEAALLRDALTGGPDLDALARKLTEGATTPRAKLDRLSAHVAQEIRYQQDYEDSIAGVKPHTPAMVVERGYGDCKDKAVLMMRLARAVGVELRFAILRTTNVGKVKTELPNQQFNHAIVYAPKQPGLDEAMFIDTTTNGLDVGNLRADDQGATSLVFDKDARWELIPIPYQSPDLEMVRHELKVDLRDASKATARDHLEARGRLAESARSALRTSEGGKRYFQGISDQLFAGTTLLSGASPHAEDVTHPVGIDLDIDVANAVKAEDDRLRFEIPAVFPLAHATSLATRQHPLRLWRGEQEVVMEADLGDRAKIVHLPATFQIDAACFSASRKAEAKDGKIVVRARYKNTCPEVLPADYPAFRASVQAVIAKIDDAIVWRAAPAAPKGK